MIKKNTKETGIKGTKNTKNGCKHKKKQQQHHF